MSTSIAKRERQRENRRIRGASWIKTVAIRTANCQSVDNSNGLANVVQVSGDWRPIASVYVLSNTIKHFCEKEKRLNDL